MATAIQTKGSQPKARDRDTSRGLDARYVQDDSLPARAAGTGDSVSPAGSLSSDPVVSIVNDWVGGGETIPISSISNRSLTCGNPSPHTAEGPKDKPIPQISLSGTFQSDSDLAPISIGCEPCSSGYNFDPNFQGQGPSGDIDSLWAKLGASVLPVREQTEGIPTSTLPNPSQHTHLHSDAHTHHTRPNPHRPSTDKEVPGTRGTDTEDQRRGDTKQTSDHDWPASSRLT